MVHMLLLNTQWHRNEIRTVGARANTHTAKKLQNFEFYNVSLNSAGARAPAAPTVPTPLEMNIGTNILRFLFCRTVLPVCSVNETITFCKTKGRLFLILST